MLTAHHLIPTCSCYGVWRGCAFGKTARHRVDGACLSLVATMTHALSFVAKPDFGVE